MLEGSWTSKEIEAHDLQQAYNIIKKQYPLMTFGKETKVSITGKGFVQYMTSPLESPVFSDWKTGRVKR